jgi:hypothetical protein
MSPALFPSTLYTRSEYLLTDLSAATLARHLNDQIVSPIPSNKNPDPRIIPAVFIAKGSDRTPTPIITDIITKTDALKDPKSEDNMVMVYQL